MKLIELNAMLRVYESNFRNLHWNAKGIDFNDSHKSITTEYYEMIGESVDETAEMIARLGENAPNYFEVAEMIQQGEKKYLVVTSSALYTREDIIKYADTMLGDICNCIEECLAEEDINSNIKNVGIKSDLEAMHSKYDLQFRYINKRKME